MRPSTALKTILALSIGGVLFSGTLTWQELFGASAMSCPSPGATGTIFGYPACVYGLFMYAAIVIVSALGLRGLRRAQPLAAPHPG